MGRALYVVQGIVYWIQNILFALAVAAIYLVVLLPSAVYVLVSERASIKKVGWDTFFLWLLCAPIQVLFNFFMWSDPPLRQA